jgi:hypothetical protein
MPTAASHRRVPLRQRLAAQRAHEKAQNIAQHPLMLARPRRKAQAGRWAQAGVSRS